MRPTKFAFTLVELLIALVLLAMLVIGFFSIDTFARYQLIASDRRVKLQNDASLVLEHITKQFRQAIGTGVPGEAALVAFPGGSVGMFGRNDTNLNGRVDISDDRWFAYYWDQNAYQLKFVDDLADTSAVPGGGEVLAERVVFFDFRDYFEGNFMNVTIVVRWNPGANPSLDNPQITMNSSVFLPAVSTN